jgi:two-component system, cell cycle response regulator
LSIQEIRSPLAFDIVLLIIVFPIISIAEMLSLASASISVPSRTLPTLHLISYLSILVLMMLDLDKFKDFNDTYGHVEGNQVLSLLGQVIKRCLRDTDSAYRYGGEEFMIMLPMTTCGEGMVTAQRIQTELRKEAFSPVLGQEVYMTISIGLSQYKSKEEMGAFVQRVDQLMYQAKKNGRNRICPES